MGASFVDSRGASVSDNRRKSSHAPNRVKPTAVEETRGAPVPGHSNTAQRTVRSTAFKERSGGSVPGYGINAAAHVRPNSFGSDLANPRGPQDQNRCSTSHMTAHDSPAGGRGMVNCQGISGSGARAPDNSILPSPNSPSSIMAYGQSSYPNPAAYSGGRPMPPMPLVPSPAAFSNKTGSRIQSRLIAGQQHGASPASKRGVFFPVPPEDSNLLPPTTTALSRSSSGSWSPASWHNAFGEEEEFWCKLG